MRAGRLGRMPGLRAKKGTKMCSFCETGDEFDRDESYEQNRIEAGFVELDDDGYEARPYEGGGY